ncbi:MAG: ferredoxin [Lachnospira sp.]|nr:ferredoxin [Lachnospira sp.]
MKYYVNENCIGCGMCEGTCPEIFHITDEGIAEAEDKEVDAAWKESAQEAMEGCPVGAIEEQ